MKTLTKEIFQKVNTGVDQRVVDFLDSVVNDIEQRKIDVTEYVRCILLMLVSQLVLYFKASDEVLKDTALSSTDDYKRKSKAPEIAILNKAHDQILNLLDKISLSPMQNAKIKRLNKGGDDESAADLLAALTS